MRYVLWDKKGDLVSHGLFDPENRTETYLGVTDLGKQVTELGPQYRGDEPIIRVFK